MPIEFKKVSYEAAAILSPLYQFQPDIQTVEYRWDPLTGEKRNYNAKYMEKARMFYPPSDEKLIEELAEKSRSNCFFCPENIEKMTPKFSAELFPGGRFRRGENWVFPNLFQIYDFTVVATLTEEHFLKLDEFSPEIFSQALEALIEFFGIVYRANPKCRYPVVGMNYLPPAGSSQFHPHLQVYLSQLPYHHIDYMIKQSKAYQEKNGANFWQELIESEKQAGERYIGKIGNVEWLTSFCPMGQDEFQGIVCGKSNPLEFDAEDIKGISQGLSKILKFYKEIGMSSFNFIIYFGPLEERSDEFWSSIRIAVRANFAPNYVSEIHLAQIFYHEAWPFSPPPEALAASFRSYAGF